MKHTKQMLTAGILSAAVLGGGLFAVGASAQSSNSDDSLASKIATKFNLKKEDVQAVVGQDRSEKRAAHQAEHQKRLEERLTKAVTDGKITEDQKAKIIAYLNSQESVLQNLEDKTDEERKAAFEAHRQEVKKWAQDNGIDEQYVLFGGKMGPHMGPKGGNRVENNN